MFWEMLTLSFSNTDWYGVLFTHVAISTYFGSNSASFETCLTSDATCWTSGYEAKVWLFKMSKVR